MGPKGLKERSNPRRDAAGCDECCNTSPPGFLLKRKNGSNEAELAMRDEPNVKLKCQNQRSFRHHKRCWLI